MASQIERSLAALAETEHALAAKLRAARDDNVSWVRTSVQGAQERLCAGLVDFASAFSVEPSTVRSRRMKSRKDVGPGTLIKKKGVRRRVPGKGGKESSWASRVADPQAPCVASSVVEEVSVAQGLSIVQELNGVPVSRSGVSASPEMGSQTTRHKREVVDVPLADLANTDYGPDRTQIALPGTNSPTCQTESPASPLVPTAVSPARSAAEDIPSDVVTNQEEVGLVVGPDEDGGVSDSAAQQPLPFVEPAAVVVVEPRKARSRRNRKAEPVTVGSTSDEQVQSNVAQPRRSRRRREPEIIPTIVIEDEAPATADVAEPCSIGKDENRMTTAPSAAHLATPRDGPNSSSKAIRRRCGRKAETGGTTAGTEDLSNTVMANESDTALAPVDGTDAPQQASTVGVVDESDAAPDALSVLESEKPGSAALTPQLDSTKRSDHENPKRGRRYRAAKEPTLTESLAEIKPTRSHRGQKGEAAPGEAVDKPSVIADAETSPAIPGVEHGSSEVHKASRAPSSVAEPVQKQKLSRPDRQVARVPKEAFDAPSNAAVISSDFDVQKDASLKKVHAEENLDVNPRQRRTRRKRAALRSVANTKPSVAEREYELGEGHETTAAEVVGGNRSSAGGSIDHHPENVQSPIPTPAESKPSSYHSSAPRSLEPSNKISVQPIQTSPNLQPAIPTAKAVVSDLKISRAESLETNRLPMRTTRARARKRAPSALRGLPNALELEKPRRVTRRAGLKTKEHHSEDHARTESQRVPQEGGDNCMKDSVPTCNASVDIASDCDSDHSDTPILRRRRRPRGTALTKDPVAAKEDSVPEACESEEEALSIRRGRLTSRLCSAPTTTISPSRRSLGGSEVIESDGFQSALDTDASEENAEESGVKPKSSPTDDDAIVKSFSAASGESSAVEETPTGQTNRTRGAATDITGSVRDDNNAAGNVSAPSKTASRLPLSATPEQLVTSVGEKRRRTDEPEDASSTPTAKFATAQDVFVTPPKSVEPCQVRKRNRSSGRNSSSQDEAPALTSTEKDVCNAADKSVQLERDVSEHNGQTAVARLEDSPRALEQATATTSADAAQALAEEEEEGRYSGQNGVSSIYARVADTDTFAVPQSQFADPAGSLSSPMPRLTGPTQEKHIFAEPKSVMRSRFNVNEQGRISQYGLGALNEIVATPSAPRAGHSMATPSLAASAPRNAHGSVRANRLFKPTNDIYSGSQKPSASRIRPSQSSIMSRPSNIIARTPGARAPLQGYGNSELSRFDGAPQMLKFPSRPHDTDTDGLSFALPRQFSLAPKPNVVASASSGRQNSEVPVAELSKVAFADQEDVVKPAEHGDTTLPGPEHHDIDTASSTKMPIAGIVSASDVALTSTACSSGELEPRKRSLEALGLDEDPKTAPAKIQKRPRIATNAKSALRSRIEGLRAAALASTPSGMTPGGGDRANIPGSTTSNGPAPESLAQSLPASQRPLPTARIGQPGGRDGNASSSFKSHVPGPLVASVRTRKDDIVVGVSKPFPGRGPDEKLDTTTVEAQSLASKAPAADEVKGDEIAEAVRGSVLDGDGDTGKSNISAFDKNIGAIDQNIGASNAINGDSRNNQRSRADVDDGRTTDSTHSLTKKQTDSPSSPELAKSTFTNLVTSVKSFLPSATAMFGNHVRDAETAEDRARALAEQQRMDAERREAELLARREAQRLTRQLELEEKQKRAEAKRQLLAQAERHREENKKRKEAERERKRQEEEEERKKKKDEEDRKKEMRRKKVIEQKRLLAEEENARRRELEEKRRLQRERLRKLNNGGAKVGPFARSGGNHGGGGGGTAGSSRGAGAVAAPSAPRTNLQNNAAKVMKTEPRSMMPPPPPKTPGNARRVPISGKKDDGPTSYEMTAERPHENDDSSDDECDSARNKKKIPTWARTKNLVQTLAKQDDDPDQHFSRVHTCNLEDVFASTKVQKKRYRTRTSSGQWRNDRLTAREEMDYKKQSGYF